MQYIRKTDRIYKNKTGRPVKKNGRKVTIQVTVEPCMADKIRDESKCNNITISNFVRSIIEKYFGIS